MLERLWGKRNTSALLVGMHAGTTPLDVSVAISQKIREQPTSRPSNTTFEYIPKGCSIIQRYVLNYVALCVIARTWKQPKCPLTEECVGDHVAPTQISIFPDWTGTEAQGITRHSLHHYYRKGHLRLPPPEDLP